MCKTLKPVTTQPCENLEPCPNIPIIFREPFAGFQSFNHFTYLVYIGSEYSLGNDVLVRWRGGKLDDPVRIMYSVHDGLWKLVASSGN